MKKIFLICSLISAIFAQDKVFPETNNCISNESKTFYNQTELLKSTQETFSLEEDNYIKLSFQFVKDNCITVWNKEFNKLSEKNQLANKNYFISKVFFINGQTKAISDLEKFNKNNRNF